MCFSGGPAALNRLYPLSSLLGCTEKWACMDILQEGRQGVEAEWEATEDFHRAWMLKARDILAKAEWRRRKLNKRVCHARSCPPASVIMRSPALSTRTSC